MIKVRTILATLAIMSASFSLMAQDDISPSRKQAIDSLALEKVRDLSKYISIVGNKDTPWSEANRVIERTLELFADGALMGVSMLGQEEVNYYGIREYLERLMALNYDKVNIQWYNIQYISDLERQPDGRYVGVITIYQRFEGTTKGRTSLCGCYQKRCYSICRTKNYSDLRKDYWLLGCFTW